MIFLDTETCGLHGMPVTLQYAENDSEIKIHDIWKRPVGETLGLIKWITESDVVGFNLAFDWFHLTKIYTTLSLCNDDKLIPQYAIDDIAMLEPAARDGLCLKPKGICDLMLVARKGPYQATMERDDVRIKKVPAVLAEHLANELEKRVSLRPIFFARRRDKYARKWTVRPHVDKATGKEVPDFSDVVLVFAPSAALKMLAIDALGEKIEDTLLFSDIEISEKLRPEEYGFAPFALAGVISTEGGIRRVLPTGPGKWRHTWPEVIRHHINHWGFNSLARKYAAKDIDYTRRIYEKFGNPVLNDNDSILSACVASCRWRGYRIDIPALEALKTEAAKVAKSAPRAPEQVRMYLEEVMDETEKIIIQTSTKKTILESVAKWADDPDDDEEDAVTEHIAAKWGSHPAAARAKEVLTARKATKEIEMYDKLIMAGRFHASFKVTGALSNRMSGADGLNPQGIDHRDIVRNCFPLAFEGMQLDGGDFKAFEVSLADAVYPDPKLHEELVSGLKIHGIFGSFIFKPMTYQEVMDSAGSANDVYGKSKSGFFAVLYFGNEYTLVTKLGVTEQNAKEGYEGFLRKYKSLAEKRKDVIEMFCSMRQTGGIGSKVEWREPAEYIESIFGFRRYFTLENSICRALFDLAQNPPPLWKTIKLKIVRRERVQTVGGATQSALFGAAFGIQSANMRAAGNHRIQSSGADITKKVQVAIWTLQPSGIGKWVVQPINIHDELQSPCTPEVSEQQKTIVESVVESLRPQVPLIGIDWKTNLTSWADK